MNSRRKAWTSRSSPSPSVSAEPVTSVTAVTMASRSSCSRTLSSLRTSADIVPGLSDPGGRLSQALPIRFAYRALVPHVRGHDGHNGRFLADDLEEVARGDARMNRGQFRRHRRIWWEQRSPFQAERVEYVQGPAPAKAIDEHAAVIELANRKGRGLVLVSRAAREPTVRSGLFHPRESLEQFAGRAHAAFDWRRAARGLARPDNPKYHARNPGSCTSSVPLRDSNTACARPLLSRLRSAHSTRGGFRR